MGPSGTRRVLGERKGGTKGLKSALRFEEQCFKIRGQEFGPTPVVRWRGLGIQV